MARKLRLEYAGAIYHVMNRGDRREPIFQDDPDRKRFVETLAECCAKTGWRVHAYVLMPNHFHLVMTTPQPNLVAGMKWFLGTYTARLNRRHKLVGRLFSGRYKSLVVDGTGNGYLKTVWTKEQLRERPKGDEAKVKLAGRLRAETVQTVEWVAKRLHLGSRAYANHLLWRARKESSIQVSNNKN